MEMLPAADGESNRARAGSGARGAAAGGGGGTGPGARRYAAYASAERVAGLMILPADGNPNRSMGMIAHPSAIRGFALSYDGRYLISAGTSDYAVFLWEVSLSLSRSRLFSGSVSSPLWHC